MMLKEEYFKKNIFYIYKREKCYLMKFKKKSIIKNRNKDFIGIYNYIIIMF